MGRDGKPVRSGRCGGDCIVVRGGQLGSVYQQV